ncbi:hypothetical protein RYA05_05895 [Pseudomonas syringae pv. actinidiae]|nr:hypothetical protein [Pseudomonas syringae pv. actinidiae]
MAKLYIYGNIIGGLVVNIFSFFARKIKSPAPVDIYQQMLGMADDAREMAKALDARIDAAKEAMVRLTGEYCVAALALNEIQEEISKLSPRIDDAIRQDNDSVARSLLSEQERMERRTKSYAESIDLLRPKVAEMKTRLDALISTKEDTLHEANMLEARARSSQTIRSISDLAGESTAGGDDMEILRATLAKFEAYAESVDEVTRSQLTVVDTPRVSEIDNRLKKRKEQLSQVK